MIRLGAPTAAERHLPFDMFDGSSEPVLGYTWNDIGSGITDDFLVRLPGASAYTTTTIARLFENGDGAARYELTQAEVAAPGRVYYRWVPSAALVVADQVVTFDTTDNEVDWTSHGRKTGDGPIRFTTTGALPTGLATATDYWIIRRTDDAFSLATSKANAFSNIEIDMTSAGSGTQTLVDTASTRQVLYNYETRIRTEEIVAESGALHAGTAQAGGATTITLATAASSSNGRYVNAVVVLTGGTGAGQIGQITGYVGSTRVATVADTWTTNPDSTTTYEILPSSSPVASAIATLENRNVEGSYKLGDLIRLAIGVLTGKASNFETDTVAFRNLADSKTRVTLTYDDTGRLTATIGDLTA